jgi:hypothetical protein
MATVTWEQVADLRAERERFRAVAESLAKQLNEAEAAHATFREEARALVGHLVVEGEAWWPKIDPHLLAQAHRWLRETAE